MHVTAHMSLETSLRLLDWIFVEQWQTSRAVQRASGYSLLWLLLVYSFLSHQARRFSHEEEETSYRQEYQASASPNFAEALVSIDKYRYVHIDFVGNTLCCKTYCSISVSVIFKLM